MSEYTALSIWEPWASLIAEGKKKIEMRNWHTRYRGDLLICAAKTHNQRVKDAIGWYQEDGVLPEGFEPKFGMAVAVATVVDCRVLTNSDREDCCLVDPTADLEEERTFGFFLENIRPIVPTPVRGKQGLFRVAVEIQFEGVMDERKRHILQHSLGGKEQYRNYFCTGPGEDHRLCEELVLEGLMRREKQVDWVGGMELYHVTQSGKNAAFSPKVCAGCGTTKETPEGWWPSKAPHFEVCHPCWERSV